jgi:alpha-tubulin suppressor-like RCC1 family protein
MSRPNQFLSPEGDLEDYFVDEYWLIDQWVGDTLWTWGRGGVGQLGVNSTVQRNTPVTTSVGGHNWKQISSGASITGGIKLDGTLWVWGNNAQGALGINNTISRSTPITTFAGGTNWKQVSCGGRTTTSSFVAAIKTDGTLWTWGNNADGMLGDNSIINRSTPVTTFAGGTNWKQVSCGRSHIAAIKTDGTLWTWGSNSGQLGINNTSNRSTPVTTFIGGNNWKQVSAGGLVTSAIKTDGTLWMSGSNGDGRLGINVNGGFISTPVTTFAGGNSWKQVSVGYAHIAAIKTDGTLWIWGAGGFGELGNNFTTAPNTRCTPVTTFAGGNNWKQVELGYRFSSAIKTDGTLWTWGNNGYGQLGVNNTTQRNTPVTTSAGGTNWKQVSSGEFNCMAVTSGTDPTFFIS